MRLLEAPVIGQLPASVLRRLGKRVPARRQIPETRVRQLQQRILIDLAGGGQHQSFGPIMNVDPAFQRCHIDRCNARFIRSEEHTSELQSLMRISYAVFCLKKKISTIQQRTTTTIQSTNPIQDVNTRI